MVKDEEDEHRVYMELREAPGATDFVSAQKFAIYLPNVGNDGDGKPKRIENLDGWVNEAKELLGRINQGATAYPELDGIWWKKRTATPVHERTRIVYSYIDPDNFLNSIDDIREFVHRFGRETGQEQVLVEFDCLTFRIEDCDLGAD